MNTSTTVNVSRSLLEKINRMFDDQLQANYINEFDDEAQEAIRGVKQALASAEQPPEGDVGRYSVQLYGNGGPDVSIALECDGQHIAQFMTEGEAQAAADALNATPPPQEPVAYLFKDYPEVLLFARAMLYKLRKNAHKDGWPNRDDRGRRWKDCDRKFLLEKLKEETSELRDEVQKISKVPIDTLDEAADVGNIAMMIADTEGVLHAVDMCRCAENERGEPARWCDLCNPKPPAPPVNDEAMRLLERIWKAYGTCVSNGDTRSTHERHLIPEVEKIPAFLTTHKPQEGK